jgi:adenine phosphoribosyltransferase
MQRIESRIRAIPDFPKPGILFRDITPLLQDADALNLAVEALAEPFRSSGVSHVAGMEARGFIFGPLVAQKLGIGFVPLRKPGKLPHQVHRIDYALEYGTDALEVHQDAVGPKDRVLIIDDLLATGGTAHAACQLIEGLKAEVVGCAFVIELDGLGGRERLSPRRLHALLTY